MAEERRAEATSTAGRRWWAHVLRPGRLLQLAAAAAVIRWLALPRLGDTSQVLGLLDEVPGGLLVVGAALGVGALVAYAQVTRSLLRRARPPGLRRAFAVVVTSVGVNRIVPFGAAAGTAVMFRLLSKEGPTSSEVGVALSVQAVGSAVLLQLLLWPSLLLVSPGHLPAAVLGAAVATGAVVLIVVGALGWALVARPASTIDAGARLVRRVRGPEGRVRAALAAVATNAAALLAGPGLLSRAAVWGVLNWLLDAASLWVFLWAFGVQVPPAWVLVAFGLANLAATVPLLPGGFGVVETTLALVLTRLGADPTPTLLGIAAYRLVHLWLPVPGAVVSYTWLRLTRRAPPTVSVEGPVGVATLPR